MTVDGEHFRELLLVARAQVAGAVDYMHVEADPSPDDEGELPSETNLADQATDLLGREIDWTLEENSEHVLVEIDAALVRIDDGTYGICARCGKPIGAERLDARPWATLCLEDKRKEERG
jgi:RNA polymerase-binding protein DksA